ncbi:uncharacterized protein [Parasteatoda tepidariorum]|uniref:uncharacterized protein n=1 Tax=Parasteatoda tepidariorum TaxID=114398 RepID=UPI00077FAFDA|nr:uncharacterized protein LOC107452295 isoform X1 [Parasteatoda tepidariorum]
MIWIILFICILERAHAGYKGGSITCECTTTHCMEHHMEHCNTTGVCFSQYLDRHDGSYPVVRGCIQSKTPLLCENRRPAVARGTWPLLLCCNSNLCNRDVVPTPPPWFENQNRENSTAAISEEQVLDTNEVSQIGNGLPIKNDVESPSSNQHSYSSEIPPILHIPLKPKTRSSSLPHIISPIYISVLVLGIISLIIIGIIATVVLKRSNRFYLEQYGALEQQQEQCCLKHATEHLSSVHVHCDCDSQVELLNTGSQPCIHAMYQNQSSNNT